MSPKSSVAFAIFAHFYHFAVWNQFQDLETQTDTKTTTQQLDLVYQMNWILVSIPLSAGNSTHHVQPDQAERVSFPSAPTLKDLSVLLISVTGAHSI